MNKITYNQVQPFLNRFNQGEFPHLRLGQAFVNEFKVECDHATPHEGACLFNETDNGKAIKMIWEQYVDAEGKP